MLKTLREGTEELHRKLEKNNLASKILDHSISLEEYKFLLYQNFLAYCSVESQISGFLPELEMNKADKIKKDLQELEVSLIDCGNALGFTCENEIEAIGAAYVLEGSAMGGMLIAKELKKCEATKQLPQQHFFAGTRESTHGFSQFLKMLRSRQFTEQEIDVAVNKAKETFRTFELAFSAQYSSY